MDYQDMMDRLAAADPAASRYPIWIISYNRAGSAPLLDIMAEWQDQSEIYVVVRNSQRQDYRQAYPGMEILGADDAKVPNCGSARWYAADLAHGFGYDRVIMADDDVTSVRFLYGGQVGRGKNTGKPCSKHSNAPEKAALPDFESRVLTLVSQTCEELLEEEQRVVQVGLYKQHLSHRPHNAATKWQVNSGTTPRQLMVWDLDRMAQAGIRLDLDAFGVHGEDIGIAATILATGYDCAALPSFVFDPWPEAVNIDRSNIRNRENSAALHLAEWQALQEYPIKDYLRVKRSLLDGAYEWGDVNWVALHKLRGTKSSRRWWADDIL